MIQSKTNQIVVSLTAILLIFLEVLSILVLPVSAITKPIDINLVDHPKAPIDIYEDVNESEQIAEAVIDTYNTSDMIQSFGYDFDYVARVVTAEAGSTTYELCSAIAQCLFNACIYEHSKFSPEDICHKYQYAPPKNFTTGIALSACEDVLVRGRMNTAVEDALYFYNSKLCYGTWHETQTYIITYDLDSNSWVIDPGRAIAGIRFFK